MISSSVFLASVVIVAAVCVALIIYFQNKLAKHDRRLQHALQNLRYEFNTRLSLLEKSFYAQQPGTEEIVYDGRERMSAADFTGNGARAWDYVAHGFTEGNGDGSYQIEGNVLRISRNNVDGRYELYLKRFVFDGVQYEKVPASAAKELRLIRLVCEVKKGAASHILRFVFKGEESKEVLSEKDVVVFNPDWEKVDLYFSVSAKEASVFRIDDLSVLTAPSAVQIRNLVLMEKI